MTRQQAFDIVIIVLSILAVHLLASGQASTFVYQNF